MALFAMKKITTSQIRAFQKTVYAHYDAQGRHALPWRKQVTPYRVFVSEVMLQQTQVPRVEIKFAEWLRVFPSWRSLTAASLREVLSVWQGLGYNRRAKWLWESAKIVVSQYRGRLPHDLAELQKLPGIGPNTAASIAAFAFDQPTIFIETNIRAVFLHHFFPQQQDIADSELLPLIEQTLDRAAPRRWYSALMDYGTQLKASLPNPSRRSRHHTQQSSFRGSNRQVRGGILRALADGKHRTVKQLAKLLGFEEERVQKAAQDLRAEALVKKQRSSFFLE